MATNESSSGFHSGDHDESSPASSDDRSGLGRLLQSGVMLSDQQQARLVEAYADGLKSYNQYNQSRLELAFSCFDKEMRLAVYELLFLLHVNDPRLANWKFLEKKYETKNGIRRQISSPTTLDLYVKDAPSGVRGMEHLASFFREEYESYVEGVFGIPPYGEHRQDEGSRWAPIVTVQSVGSIGTIGHKTVDSDLDLQVVYDLNPFVYTTTDWHDGTFKDALNREHRWWINALRRQQHLTLEEVRQPEIKAKLSAQAAERVARSYPGLYRYLVREDREFATTLFRSKDKTLRIQVLHEILDLMKRAEKLHSLSETYRRDEALLKERLERIQNYINRKFPSAEIYLFVYAVEGFRHGQYSSTLEFKESSGSAYEMILNYDTLMPGIQFTPMVPTHFLLPKPINDDVTLFNRLVDYVRFQAVNLWDSRKEELVDLGPTPDLDQLYVARHGGAIYWEAFKASSGNLPKAILNLFRFEMLLDKHFATTVIQMIKDPLTINTLAAPKPKPKPPEAKPKTLRDTIALMQASRTGQSAPLPVQAAPDTPEGQMEAMASLRTGLPAWAVLEIEEKFPALLLDPWWLRYKALKIGFGEENGVAGIPTEERHRISKVIDLAFCLHLRISDVLNKPPKKGTTPSYRDEVLSEVLERAFPAGSPRRINLEGLLTGGVRGLIFFEKEMRDLFQRSMTRVEGKMAELGIRDHAGARKEVDLWLNYYVENFQPPLNVVPRVIMKHLKTARDGIEISHRPGQSWVFMSIQKPKTLLDSVKAARNVSYLPERVLLLENSGFLSGLGHCVLNGYFGVLDKGTQEERQTRLELEHNKVNMGQNIHNDLAFVTVEQVTLITRYIAGFFGYQPYNYLDILRKDRKITGVYVFLNLWRFGQLSVLYRDNLSTWYCEEFELREVFDQALTLTKDMTRLLRAKPIHDTLGELFRRKKIDLKEVALAAWANPNSLTPDRSQSFPDRLKDMEQGVTFSELILKQQASMAHKPPEESAPAARA